MEKGNNMKEVNTSVKCFNGIYEGVIEKNGVISFKGIPYAKPPVGKLRWRAPEPMEPGSGVFRASSFGKSSIQYECFSEPASSNETGEDCLTLNVWTGSLEDSDKPVMFYIHGGGFSWGGTADPLYNGQYIVEKHKDVVVVTCNYRVGLMGFADFSRVPGGESYSDSTHLAVLDIIQGLKWVKENIRSFGGNPDNITVFGESAGGALTSILLVVKAAEGLFHKAVIQSGTFNLTYTQEDSDRAGLVQALMEKTSAENMQDLLDLSEKEITDAYTAFDDEGFSINDICVMPLRDRGFIHENPYEALRNGASKDIPVIIGTNKDEWRYWATVMIDTDHFKKSEEEMAEDIRLYEKYIADEKYNDAYVCASEEEKKNLNSFLESLGDMDNIWKYTELGNETVFRMPSIALAYNHKLAGGDTYMYYFCKESDNFDFIGACHASELAYIFNNPEEKVYSGTVDKNLADSMCSIWVEFARSGKPDTDQITWKQYDTETRATMIIGNDGSLKTENDPLREQRQLLEPFVKYYLK